METETTDPKVNKTPDTTDDQERRTRVDHGTQFTHQPVVSQTLTASSNKRSIHLSVGKRRLLFPPEQTQLRLNRHVLK